MVIYDKGIYDKGRKLDFWAHNTQTSNYVGTPECYMLLLTIVTPIHLIKEKINANKMF